MNKILKYWATMLIILGSLCGCENEPFLYRDNARVRLVGDYQWAVGSDSVEFSFLSQVASLEEFDIRVDAVIMGEVQNYDRTVKLEVISSLTTAAQSQYSFPATVTVPSGSDRGSFFVTLKKDAALEQKAVRLAIGIVESSDFMVGVNEENHISFIWSNMLKKPSYWDILEEHFGSYSNTKYRFMLDCMLQVGDGSTDLDPNNLNWSDYHNYKNIFIGKLKEYNAAHAGAALTDENGVLVSFPQ